MAKPKKSLAIFDIDGTLIKMAKMGQQADDAAFARALKVELAVDISTDWSVYKHATDSGIIREVLEKRLSRPARKHEMEDIKRRFSDLMRESCKQGRLNCEPVSGGDSIFEDLLEGGRWGVAIATGNWAFSARLKLESAGIPYIGVPIASADDAEARTEIVRTAIERAKAHYDADEFASIVYVGDRPWDVEAAREAGIGFVGIADNKGAKALRQAGHFGDIHPDITTLRGHFQRYLL